MKGLSRNPSPTVSLVHRPEMSRGLANFPNRACNSGNRIANVLNSQSQKGERLDRGSPVAGWALEHRPSTPELIDCVNCNTCVTRTQALWICEQLAGWLAG
jgi:hypothetical protein